MKSSLTLAAAACLVAFPLAAVAARDTSEKPATVDLQASHGSGEHGTAKLTPLPGRKTKVDIALDGTPKNEAQTADIAPGDCANAGAPSRYRLKDVKDGKSSTELPARMEDLVGANLSVQVHGAGQPKADVACGEIAANARKE